MVGMTNDVGTKLRLVDVNLKNGFRHVSNASDGPSV